MERGALGHVLKYLDQTIRFVGHVEVTVYRPIRVGFDQTNSKVIKVQIGHGVGFESPM